MTDTINRRSLVLAIGAGTALTVTTPVSALVPNKPSASFFAKVALYKRLMAEAEGYDQEVYNPAHDRFEAACKDVPHVTLEPDFCTGRAEPVSTADPYMVRAARDFRERVSAIDPDLVKHGSFMHRLAEAADQRDAEILRLERVYHIDEYADHSEALTERACKVASELIETPAPDAAALGWKIEHLWADDPGAAFCEEWTDIIVADARRLLGTGRA